MERKTFWFENDDLVRLRELSKQTGISESALMRTFLSDGLNSYTSTEFLIQEMQEFREEIRELKQISLAGVAATSLLNIERAGPQKKSMYPREDNIIFAKGAFGLAGFILEEFEKSKK